MGRLVFDDDVSAVENRDPVVVERAGRIFRGPYPDIEIPDVSLTRFVFERAGELGDKPAFVDGPTGRTLTYSGLSDAVRRAAAGLVSRGFQKGDVFAA